MEVGETAVMAVAVDTAVAGAAAAAAAEGSVLMTGMRRVLGMGRATAMRRVMGMDWPMRHSSSERRGYTANGKKAVHCDRPRPAPWRSKRRACKAPRTQ
jgi:hypothetical protein